MSLTRCLVPSEQTQDPRAPDGTPQVPGRRSCRPAAEGQLSWEPQQLSPACLVHGVLCGSESEQLPDGVACHRLTPRLAIQPSSLWKPPKEVDSVPRLPRALRQRRGAGHAE